MRLASASRIAALVVVLGFSPHIAEAQTSAIAGTVRDSVGAVLPGVTVEVVESGAHRESPRPPSPTAPGCTGSKPAARRLYRHLHAARLQRREARGIELTSDFTARRQRRAEGRRPRGDDHRHRRVAGRRHAEHHAADRDDARGPRRDPDGAQHPGGRHHDSRHQPVARRRRRAVARRRRLGRLQQSPLQFRGSNDAVQTVDGMRLNNLEAQRLSTAASTGTTAASGAQLRHRRRFRRDGAGRHPHQHGAEGRRQHLPRRPCSPTTPAKAGRPATCASNLRGSRRLQPEQRDHERQRDPEDLGLQPGVGGPIMRDRLWFQGDVPPLGRREDRRRQLLRRRPVALSLHGRT